MLPDIDANDGNMSQERILVRSGDDLQALGGRVQTLYVDSDHQIMSRWFRYLALTSHPHPEP